MVEGVRLQDYTGAADVWGIARCGKGTRSMQGGDHD